MQVISLAKDEILDDERGPQKSGGLQNKHTFTITKSRPNQNINMNINK